jgi:hypothetical protein
MLSSALMNDRSSRVCAAARGRKWSLVANEHQLTSSLPLRIPKHKTKPRRSRALRLRGGGERVAAHAAVVLRLHEGFEHGVDEGVGADVAGFAGRDGDGERDGLIEVQHGL